MNAERPIRVLRRPTSDGQEFELPAGLPEWLDSELRALNRYATVDVSRERGGCLVLRLHVDAAADPDPLVREIFARLGIDSVCIAAAPTVCAMCRGPDPVAETGWGELCERCLDSTQWSQESASSVEVGAA